MRYEWLLGLLLLAQPKEMPFQLTENSDGMRGWPRFNVSRIP